jgi:DNA-binding response OmpR family regulator
MAQPLRLLLVEDDEDMALLMQRRLERAGHQVTRCDSPEDALQVLAVSTFDLISLDMFLPGMDGLELLQSLRRAGINTPVIMVTPADDERLIAEVIRAGALDFVVQDAGREFLKDLPERVSKAVGVSAPR